MQQSTNMTNDNHVVLRYMASQNYDESMTDIFMRYLKTLIPVPDLFDSETFAVNNEVLVLVFTIQIKRYNCQ